MQHNDANMRRMVRNAAILFGAFMLGLIPVLIRNLELKQELAQSRAELTLSETRDVASRAYLEASRNNFGVAAEHTSALYERLADVAQAGEDPARSIARDALSRRDEVMRMLATADSAARTELQELTHRLLSAHPAGTQTRARTR
jgi:hypothetical protein